MGSLGQGLINKQLVSALKEAKNEKGLISFPKLMFIMIKQKASDQEIINLFRLFNHQRDHYQLCEDL
jgi:Ca2+-binding EF-hand superfamily protein